MPTTPGLVQSCVGTCVGGTTATATFTSRVTGHNTIIVYGGWRGSVDSVALTITDNNHNAWGSRMNLIGGSGSHTWVIKASTNNARPDSGSFRTQITITASQAGDITFVAVELSAGSGNVVGGAFSSSFGGYEASGQGVGELSVTGPSQSLDSVYAFFGTYAQPRLAGPDGAHLIGSFPGGSPTYDGTFANPNTGNVTIYESIYAAGTGIAITGLDVTFAATPPYPGADVLTLLLCPGFVAGAHTFDADTITTSPPPGEYNSNQSVTLACTSYGVDIHYTADGTTPTSGSPTYSSPISVTRATTIKAYAHDPSGFWTDGPVATYTYDIYTGVVNNPGNAIDGNDTTYAELICTGAAGDQVALKLTNITGTLGSTGTLNVDFEVTQNDLVASAQIGPAWKISAIVSGTETTLASGTKGAGTVARNIVTQSVPPGTVAAQIAAKILGSCEIVGSTGGVTLRVYGAYLTV